MALTLIKLQKTASFIIDKVANTIDSALLIDISKIKALKRKKNHYQPSIIGKATIAQRVEKTTRSAAGAVPSKDDTDRWTVSIKNYTINLFRH